MTLSMLAATFALMTLSMLAATFVLMSLSMLTATFALITHSFNASGDVCSDYSLFQC